jgi:NADPH-dependent glutamate synthase beta subunit-like oxidoreductase
MANIKIDNIELNTDDNITVLEAARQAGISIPSMCFVNGHHNHPSCMVCLVRDNKSGAFIPSCALKVTEGMDISASSQDVISARRKSLELLLSDHVGDCEAPCSLACPAGMDIPLMNRLIGEGKFTDALTVVRNDIALPYILGYICPAPCEKACRRKQIDDAVSVCILKRFSAKTGTDKRAEGLINEHKAGNAAGKGRIAIIGSGPAGLSAAYYLLLKGYSCTLYDMNPEPGGALRYEISEKDLPREVINQEINIIRSMGAEFCLNERVNEEVFNLKIRKNADAVVIATGEISVNNDLVNTMAVARSGYQVNEDTLASSLPGVFICGSAIRPNKMAVRSVAQGKTVAEAVDCYIQQKDYKKPGRLFNSRFDKLQPVEFDEVLKESVTSERLNPIKGYIEGFTEDEAIIEAKRCLHCDCRKKDNCKLRIYANEYDADRKKYLIGNRKVITKQMQHFRVVFEPEKCIKCGLCIEISAAGGEKYGLAFEGRGFDVSVRVPLSVSLNEGITITARECVSACPTGALSFITDNYNLH